MKIWLSIFMAGFFLKKKIIKQLNGDAKEDAKVIKCKTNFHSSQDYGKLPIV